MGDFIRVLIVTFAAVNPALLAETSAKWVRVTPARERQRGAAVALAVGLGLCGIIAVLSSQLLDLLDISGPSFRIAAGVVMAPFGLATIVRRWPMAEEIEPGWKAGLSPFGLGLMAAPPSLVVAVLYGNEDGTGIAIAALALAMLPTAGHLAVTKLGSTRWVDWIARALAAVLVVAAVDLIVQGVQAV